jgi:hypothetical protein
MKIVGKKGDFDWKTLEFFSVILIAFLVFFTLYVKGFSYPNFHIMFHILIALFCFGILLFSLRLNKSAKVYIFIGALLGIVIEVFFFTSHFFGRYYFLISNPLRGSIWIVSILLLMEGFKVAKK